MALSSMKLCLCLVIVAHIVGSYSTETERTIVKSEKAKNGSQSVSSSNDTVKVPDYRAGTGEKHPLMREVYSDVKSVLKYLPDVSGNLSETGRRLNEVKRFALGFMDDVKMIRNDVAKIKHKATLIYQNVTGQKKAFTKVVSKAVKNLTKLTNSSFENLLSTLREECGNSGDNHDNVASNISKIHEQVSMLAAMWPTMELSFNNTVQYIVELGSNYENIKQEIQQCNLLTSDGFNRLDTTLEIAFTGLNEDTKLIHERVVTDIGKVTNQISDLKKLIVTTCQQQQAGRIHNRKLHPKFSPLDIIRYWPWIQRIMQFLEFFKDKDPVVGVGGSIGVGHLLNGPDIMKNLTGLFGGVAGIMLFPDVDIREIPWHLLIEEPIPIGTPRPATPEPEPEEPDSGGFWSWPISNLGSIWDIINPTDQDKNERPVVPDYYNNNDITETTPGNLPGMEELPELPSWVPALPTIPPIIPEITLPPIIPTIPSLPPIPGIFPEPSIPSIPELLPLPSIPDIYPTKPEVTDPAFPTTEEPTLPPSMQYTLLEPAVPFVAEPLKGYCPCVCPCECTCPIVPIESEQKTSSWWMQFYHFNQKKKNKPCECLCACPCPNSVTTTEAPVPVTPAPFRPTSSYLPGPIDYGHLYYDDIPQIPAWDIHSDEDVHSDEHGNCVQLSNRVLREIRTLKQDFDALKVTVRDEIVITRESILGQMNAKFAEITSTLAGIHKANVILHTSDQNATETVHHAVKTESAKTLYTLGVVHNVLRKINTGVNNMSGEITAEDGPEAIRRSVGGKSGGLSLRISQISPGADGQSLKPVTTLNDKRPPIFSAFRRRLNSEDPSHAHVRFHVSPGKTDLELAQIAMRVAKVLFDRYRSRSTNGAADASKKFHSKSGRSDNKINEIGTKMFSDEAMPDFAYGAEDKLWSWIAAKESILLTPKPDQTKYVDQFEDSSEESSDEK